MDRIQTAKILDDLKHKMVLLAGPRQAGKTWLAKHIATYYQHSLYLNYDNIEHRDIIKERAWLDNTELLILDELHKLPKWKNYLKGIYDTKPEHLHILVTGSASLSYFQHAGDSLAGRFFLHHLFPLTLAELKQNEQEINLDKLLERSGFPEPYLAESATYAKRWQQQYIDSIIRHDALTFENIQDAKALQLTFEILRTKVGSPISYQSIAGDIGISPNTVKKYIQILEALYVVFRLTPFSKNIARSLLKEPKIYFFDHSLVIGDVGLKFENLVANALLKHTQALNDYEGKNHKLNYLRTKDNKEVDFAISLEQHIEEIVEVKMTDNNVNKSLNYFHKKYQFSATQIVKNLKTEKKHNDIAIVQAENFLTSLYM